MIEIEAAQKILIRFAVAAVLRDDQAGHDFHQLTGPQHRAQIQLLVGHDALTRRHWRTTQAVELTGDRDFFQHRRWNAAGPCRRSDQRQC